MSAQERNYDRTQVAQIAALLLSGGLWNVVESVTEAKRLLDEVDRQCPRHKPPPTIAPSSRPR